MESGCHDLQRFVEQVAKSRFMIYRNMLNRSWNLDVMIKTVNRTWNPDFRTYKYTINRSGYSDGIIYRETKFYLN